MIKQSRRAFALAPVVLWLAACSSMGNDVPSWGSDLVAVTVSGKLVTFNHGAPGTINSSVQIAGLAAGESIVGIDYRPADGKLYGLGNGGHLYLLSVDTGSATAKASLHADAGDTFMALSGSAFGMSFNPVDGRLRVISDTGQNLSVDADNGAVQTEAAFDPAKTSVVAAAYTTQPNGPFQTMLYVFNSKGSEIDVTPAPKNGKLTTVGALDTGFGNSGGFDIVGNETSGMAYAAIAAPDAGASKLYLVKLGAGSAKSVGTIGGKEKVTGLAIRHSLDS